MSQTTAYVLCYFPKKLLRKINERSNKALHLRFQITFNCLSLSIIASSSLSWSDLTNGNARTNGNWCVLFRGFRCGITLLGRLVIFHSSMGLVHFVYCLRLFPLDVNMNGWPSTNNKEQVAFLFCFWKIFKFILLSRYRMLNWLNSWISGGRHNEWTLFWIKRSGARKKRVVWNYTILLKKIT